MRGSKGKWPSTLFTRSPVVSATRFDWVRKRSRRVRSQVFQFLVTHLFTNRFVQLDSARFAFTDDLCPTLSRRLLPSTPPTMPELGCCAGSIDLLPGDAARRGRSAWPLPAWPLPAWPLPAPLALQLGLFQLGLFSLGHLGPVSFNDQPSAARFVRDIRAHRLLISLSCPLSKGKSPRLMHRFSFNFMPATSASAFAAASLCIWTHRSGRPSYDGPGGGRFRIEPVPDARLKACILPCDCHRESREKQMNDAEKALPGQCILMLALALDELRRDRS